MNSSLMRRLVFQTVQAYDEDEEQKVVEGGPAVQQAPKTRAKRGNKPVEIIRSVKTRDMTWHDHLVMLLRVAAAIEHGLMVQYLYAAYSMGGDQVPEDARPALERWRESIISVAKEEMGHLLTIQNLLSFVGASINLDRGDFPWDVKYYPFPFRLEPLTVESLSCYVYAEMPEDREIALNRNIDPRYKRFLDEDKKRISDAIVERDETPHRVGMLYSEIAALLKNRKKIPDHWLRPGNFRSQASMDDWGRGYGGGLFEATAEEAWRLKAVERPHSERPDASYHEAKILIRTMRSRDEAIEALEEISQQGEGPRGTSDKEVSHFDRFLEVYQEYIGSAHAWSISRNLAVNPTTLNEHEAGNRGSFIASKYARHWGYLFNVRYRMLLTGIAHYFRAPAGRKSTPGGRSMMMHRVFGEMYNLKAIARLMVRLPLRYAADYKYAGPPFEMPYTTRLPADEQSRWGLYLDMIETSAKLSRGLLRAKEPPDEEGKQYLRALRNVDIQTWDAINAVLPEEMRRERETRHEQY